MKKSLGQNFLRDEKILGKIADFARIEKNDTVVEVGPGEGTLTKFLLQKAAKIIAIEKDGDLAHQLKNKFAREIEGRKLEVKNDDILNFKLKILNFKLVGNIPYYITGALFQKFLQNPPGGSQPQSITFVVQKEVAQRILARDGKESILSISVKAYGEPEIGGVIKAGSFHPKPKVDSAIIAIRNVNKERFKERNVSEEKFFETVKKGFAHKRKLLVKNLGLSEEIFGRLGIPPKARAEDLKLDDWFGLARNIP